MDYMVAGYRPKGLFHKFEEICSIPHASGQERKLADYLEQFARDRGLWYKRDDLHNLIIKKPGTAGFEKAPALILQAHMDRAVSYTHLLEITKLW